MASHVVMKFLATGAKLGRDDSDFRPKRSKLIYTPLGRATLRGDVAPSGHPATDGPCAPRIVWWKRVGRSGCWDIGSNDPIYSEQNHSPCGAHRPPELANCLRIGAQEIKNNRANEDLCGEGMGNGIVEAASRPSWLHSPGELSWAPMPTDNANGLQSVCGALDGTGAIQPKPASFDQFDIGSDSSDGEVERSGT